MEFRTKFDNGQRVWVVLKTEHYQIIRCVTCSSTGKVSIGGDEFICPGCNGRSSRRNYAGSKYYISDTGTIGKVSVEDQMLGYDPKFRITYMIDTTGVGSGTVYEQSQIFASEEEAKSYCDRMNGVLPQNEEVGEPIPESKW